MRKSCLFLFVKCLLPFFVSAQAEEFYGYFSSWTDLKIAYHAAGNGIADDTKAMQQALDELGSNGHSPVLYIPKGVYRITATLTMQSKNNIVIIGEDPLNTIIKWDGEEKMKMLSLNGVAYSEYARITWDGNNKALAAVAHEWDRKVQYANSGTQHCDEIFKNVAVGLKSGPNMDAEFSIRRCRFYNCSSAGIFLGGPNALDWWIWDAYFENCYTGVSNNVPGNGAGNFHVYRSVFNHSTHADISLGNSNYFSFRDNLSYNSNAFFIASQFSNTSPITIQHNTIFSTAGKIMVDMYTKGNVLFLDNTFITPDSNKNFVIHYEDAYKNTLPDLTMIGNSFTAKQKIIKQTTRSFIDIDNKYGVPVPKQIKPLPKAFAPLIKYKLYEVNNTMNADAIQAIINKASKNATALIHFKYGVYNISKTLTISENSSVLFCGDGFSTILKWMGDSGKAVIQVNNARQAIIKNVKVSCSKKADGILVYDNNKTGNTIYANELLTYAAIRSNLLINNITNTDLRFENLQHNYCNAVSVQMSGSASQYSSLLKIFGAASINNKYSYQVNDNKKMLVYDQWFENGGGTNFITLKDKGEFYMNGAKIAAASKEKLPVIAIDSFSGKAVIAEAIYNTPNKTTSFNNPSGKAKMLLLGTLSWTDSTNNFYKLISDTVDYGILNCRYNVGPGSIPLPDQGNKSNTFIKEMLSTIRSTLVSAKPAYIKLASHFTIDRVFIENGINNLHVEKTP
ncbi:right-handed parallel beta-helix repeat-containing protein [Ferruginibacter albus]|uniref:right-handed parallel beta-helix repeat-containing protein n=1 Tax=Ferruginibacter albus TaxID=2875540 RepID=UPI001CC48B68|nr:right-handed parallel beta-helix repeat-containing protein [Ferruginibacter albus]UAY51500.1 right-handed parallel beta-helix repeat-containing protein [Ferruginibacter albus]